MAIDLYELAIRFKSEGFPAVKKNLDTMDKQGQTLVNRFSGMSKALTGIASAAAVVAVGKFLKSAIGEAMEAEQVMNELRGAVNNAGGDFALLKASTDAAADGMAKMTRFSDDAARGALTRMISISGDTKRSIDNLGLAADIAAGKHITLEQAAEIVGKTMSGNTRGLKEFGITTKDSGEALDQLRSKFRGFAEKDGASLQGRLEQIKNAWGEVLEAAGKALTGADSLPDALARVTEKLMALSGWIDKNASAWQAWAGRVSNYIEGVERRMNNLQNIAYTINRFFGGNPQSSNGAGSRGGGGGGGRDFGIGMPMLPGAVVMAPGRGGSGHSTPTRSGGSGKGAKAGKEKSLIPNFEFGRNVDMAAMARMEAIGTGEIDILAPLRKRFEETPEEIAKLVEGLKQKIETGPINQLWAEMGANITSGIATTLGDAVYNAFASAFNGDSLGGIFKAFGKTILAGLGQIITHQGQALLTYGITMQAAALGLTNPFTAGPAAIAAGAALIALGSAFGAIANGGGGRGTAQAGAFRERGGTTDIVRLKFVDRPGMSSQLLPMQPMQFNIIGPDDPKAQRAIGEIIKKGGRR